MGANPVVQRLEVDSLHGTPRTGRHRTLSRQLNQPACQPDASGFSCIWTGLDWTWTVVIAHSDDVGRPFRLLSAGVALHGLDQPPTRGEVVAFFAELPVVLRLALGLTCGLHHCSHLQSVYPSSMRLMIQIDRQKLVDELREMAGVASTADVREALFRMAERYAVRAAPNRHAASRICFVAANGGCPGVLEVE
jgi:hypothetical protein